MHGTIIAREIGMSRILSMDGKKGQISILCLLLSFISSLTACTPIIAGHGLYTELSGQGTIGSLWRDRKDKMEWARQENEDQEAMEKDLQLFRHECWEGLGKTDSGGFNKEVQYGGYRVVFEFTCRYGKENNKLLLIDICRRDGGCETREYVE